MTETDDARANRTRVAMEDLVTANHESNATMLALVEQVRRETQARDRKIAVMEKANRQTRFLTYLMCGATVVMLCLAVVNAVNIAAARGQQAQIARINETLLDCVNATGECGRLNAASQAEVLNQVKEYNLVGFYCIRTNPATADPKGEAFLRCMARLYPNGPTLSER